jgi:hypothetical protein
MRLGLALNFSVFHYEILNEPNSACRMAKQVCSICCSFFSLFTHAHLFYRPSMMLWQNSNASMSVITAVREKMNRLPMIKITGYFLFSISDSTLIMQLLRDNLTVSIHLYRDLNLTLFEFYRYGLLMNPILTMIVNLMENNDCTLYCFSFICNHELSSVFFFYLTIYCFCI